MDYKEFRRKARIDTLNDVESFYSELYNLLEKLKNGYLVPKKDRGEHPHALIWSYDYIYDNKIFFDLYYAKDQKFINSYNIKQIFIEKVDEILVKYHYRWSLLGDNFIKEYFILEYGIKYGAYIDMYKFKILKPSDV